MTTLYHFGGQPFDKNRRFLPLDTDHKPGGLWLTEDRIDGWKNHVLRRIAERASGWCYGDLRFMSVFEIGQTCSAKNVLTITREEDMENFLESYLETSNRNCKGKNLESIRDQCIPNCSGSCYNCYGFHIDWDRVKVAYQGLALTYYSEEISHRSNNPRLHWSRLDCASWCFWDISCLTLVEENVRTEYKCDGRCFSTYCPMK